MSLTDPEVGATSTNGASPSSPPSPLEDALVILPSAESDRPDFPSKLLSMGVSVTLVIEDLSDVDEDSVGPPVMAETGRFDASAASAAARCRVRSAWNSSKVMDTIVLYRSARYRNTRVNQRSCTDERGAKGLFDPTLPGYLSSVDINTKIAER